jgi:hypothetical protein
VRIVLAAAFIATFVGVGCGAATAASNVPAAGPPSSEQYGPTKVQVCYRTKSSTKPYVTLSIPRVSLAGYLRRGATVGPCVYGSVRTGGAVSLRTWKGRPISTLEARRLYSIVVTDSSGAENFHLTGKGVDRHTGLAFRGSVRWKITFARGLYRYRSDAHPRLQRSFTVPKGST